MFLPFVNSVLVVDEKFMVVGIDTTNSPYVFLGAS